MAFEVRKLKPNDDRSRFRTGNLDLERFFARYAGQNQFRHHIGTTYVAISDSGAIAGFATVSASEIRPPLMLGSKVRHLPRYPLPALRLARLAVDESFKGQGVGQLLLRAVIVLALQMAEDMGCVAVLVDAKPEAVEFYKKLGFFNLEVVAGEIGDRPQPIAMALELAQLRATK